MPAVDMKRRNLSPTVKRQKAAMCVIMKVRYLFPLDRPMQVEDHWPVPLLGGQCRLIETDGLVTAIEFTKGGVSTDLAFSVMATPDEFSKATITGNDALLPAVRDHIKRAFSFLQCFFNSDISVDEVEVHHEPESPQEAAAIAMPTFKMGKKEYPLPLPYDMLTRALMVAEDQEPPEFVSSLAAEARKSLIAGRYIDSFRFSFLLLESLFGGGKFKTIQLKQQFTASSELLGAISTALAEWVTHPSMKVSESLKLIETGPTAAQIAEHFVDMRGHYFHGNLAKPGAWHPGKQEEANALASLAVAVVMVIASEAAAPMFASAYAQKHFDEAGQAGAHVRMEVTYLYRLPGDDDLLHEEKFVAKAPGTKPTTLMAMDIAWRCVEDFRKKLPIGRLHSVRGTMPDGGDVFHLRFLTENDGPVASSKP
jgi:hypothetical protein